MISIYKPRCRDLWFRQAMMADEETMSYNRAWGGTIPFPEEQWDAWYDRWVENPEGDRFYRYVWEEGGAFIGEIAYRFDEEAGGYMASVVIFAEYRGRGWGGMALDALCAAARENGVSVLYDDVAEDNPAVGLFLRHGFSVESRSGGTVRLKKEL